MSKTPAIVEGFMRVGIVEGEVIAASVIMLDEHLANDIGEDWIVDQEHYAALGTPMQVEVWPTNQAMDALRAYMAKSEGDAQ